MKIKDRPIRVRSQERLTTSRTKNISVCPRFTHHTNFLRWTRIASSQIFIELSDHILDIQSTKATYAKPIGERAKWAGGGHGAVCPG